MNRTTLINTVAARTSEPLGIVEQIIDAALGEIMAATERGDSVALLDFGAWHPETIAGRGDCPSYRGIRFRAANKWRSRLNRQVDEAAE